MSWLKSIIVIWAHIHDSVVMTQEKDSFCIRLKLTHRFHLFEQAMMGFLKSMFEKALRRITVAVDIPFVSLSKYSNESERKARIGQFSNIS